MIEQIFQNADGEAVIVWIPFLVQKRHLQASLMNSLPLSPQPISVSAAEERPALLPPPPSKVPIERKPRRGLASSKQIEYVRKIARNGNMNDAEVCREVGASSIEQMTNAQANDFIKKFKDFPF